jgi:hypothetical protein
MVGVYMSFIEGSENSEYQEYQAAIQRYEAAKRMLRHYEVEKWRAHNRWAKKLAKKEIMKETQRAIFDDKRDTHSSDVEVLSAQQQTPSDTWDRTKQNSILKRLLSSLSWNP